MNMEAMNKKFRLLLEKYLPGERAELVADSDIGCGARLKKDAEWIKLLPWRVERRFTRTEKNHGKRNAGRHFHSSLRGDERGGAAAKSAVPGAGSL